MCHRQYSEQDGRPPRDVPVRKEQRYGGNDSGHGCTYYGKTPPVLPVERSSSLLDESPDESSRVRAHGIFIGRGRTFLSPWLVAPPLLRRRRQDDVL